MFSRIMVPVDLSHVDRLAKALQCAADIARLYDIRAVYAGVTAETPGPLGHNPAEYDRHLAEFAAEQGRVRGIRTGHHAVSTHDPSIDMNGALVGAAEAVGADLIVMASHAPGFWDHIWPSHGESIASHAKVSVLLVRD